MTTLAAIIPTEQSLRVFVSHRLRGRVERLTVDSRALSGNKLGDPTSRSLFVYVPAAASEHRRLPAVVMLPGYGANHLSILSHSPWKLNTVEAFDAQIERGECAPAFLVLPDCMTRWGGSQFVDSPVLGNYQTYLADEVLPAVDEAFHTVPEAAGRAVVGRSSGGFGALRLAMDRPDVVSALASHAGDAAFEISMRPMLTKAAIGVERAGGLEAFASRLPDGGPRNSLEFDAAFVLCCAAAYASAPGSAFPYAELPVDIATGAIVDARFGEWIAHDPLTRIPDHREALAGLRAIFLDAGSSDEHGLHYAARAMADAMRAVGVEPHLEEYEGGHRGTSYRYETSLPYVIERLEGGAAPHRG